MFYMTCVANNIFLPDIATVQVRNIIFLIKNSSVEWDDISAYVTKRCIDLHIEPLTNIIDIVFQREYISIGIKIGLNGSYIKIWWFEKKNKL